MQRKVAGAWPRASKRKLPRSTRRSLTLIMPSKLIRRRPISTRARTVCRVQISACSRLVFSQRRRKSMSAQSRSLISWPLLASTTTSQSGTSGTTHSVLFCASCAILTLLLRTARLKSTLDSIPRLLRPARQRLSTRSSRQWKHTTWKPSLTMLWNMILQTSSMSGRVRFCSRSRAASRRRSLS
eukprot:Mycagemm_TRINITY_DN4112_c0_g1::TRINITY_DN4112_c0_g1_i1::g.4699::m.4699 type:complete len:184 gc:universal TRINITY_DN4112_c0_g1_i1:36-587(+)